MRPAAEAGLMLQAEAADQYMRPVLTGRGKTGNGAQRKWDGVRRREKADLIAALFFGLIQRNVGLPQQFVPGNGAAALRAGSAEAGGRLHLGGGDKIR